MAVGRFRLRVEPYDPDAIDADNDGIVQEGTAWERPGGTRIVDSLLNEIRRGMTSTNRSSQFRVVDRSGKPVSYTPTYMRGAGPQAVTPESGKPLSALGATLRERGLRPIGEGRTLRDRFDAAQSAAASAQSLSASAREQQEIFEAVQEAGRSLSLRRATMLADVMTAEEVRFQAQLDLQARQLLNAEPIPAVDRAAAETLVLAGTYWATYLFGGGEVGSVLNDIATGVGDASIQDQISVLTDMFAIGGVVGMKAAMSGLTERYGTAREKIDEFVDRFAERMRAQGVKFQEMREDVAESIRNVMRQLGALMRLGPNRDSNKPAAEEIAEAAERAAEVSADTQRILDRNAEIADRIAELGGSITNDIDDAFIEKNGQFSGAAVIETKSQAFDRRRRRMAADFDAVRRAILNGGIVEDDSRTIYALDERLAHGKTKAHLTQVMFDGISPEVKELIATKTDEELFEIMERRALQFHQGLDRRVRVRASQGTLLQIAEDGRYKTTHEARSQHSGAAVRASYEVRLGIPYDAEADLRPASGYVVHPDWERTQIEHLRPYLGDKSDDDISKFLFLDVSKNPAGHVVIYGESEIVLKPEVSGRTQYGRGDSLTSNLRPTQMGSDNPEEIMHALNWSGGQSDSESIKYASGLLQTEVDGHFGNLNLYHPKYNPDGTRNTENIQRGYFEALIGGSFSIDDIEKVRVSVKYLDAITKNDDDLSDEGFVDAIANPDRLRSLGFSDEEIAYIMANKGAYNFSSWFQGYRDFKRRERAKEKMDSLGVPIEYIQDLPGGRDPFDLGSYRGSEGYTSIEDLLVARSRENVRQAMEAERQRAERQALIDAGMLVEDEEESVL